MNASNSGQGQRQPLYSQIFHGSPMYGVQVSSVTKSCNIDFKLTDIYHKIAEQKLFKPYVVNVFVHYYSTCIVCISKNIYVFVP